MILSEALNILEKMTDIKFNIFLDSLPLRVQLCVRGGLVDWKTTLPEWYLKQQENNVLY